MEFVRIGDSADIPKNGMKGFVVNGKKILIANVDGKLCAIASLCTHVGGPLEKGKFDGKEVTCPWHGSIFDVATGKVIHGPAQKDEQRYEVKVEAGEIFISI